MANVNCYACDQAATNQCPRCGQPYCPAHGQPALGGCAQCLHPASIVPSGGLFRGSLLALLIGSALALWLLIRPPGLPGGSDSVIRPLPTATPTPTTSPSPTPIATSTSTATPTPTVTPSPTPTPAPTFQTYVVQEGDTLFGIADQFGVTVEDIAALNGINDPETHLLQPGDELKIPLPTPTPTSTPGGQ